MKPISLSLLCLFVMSPFLFMADVHVDMLARKVELKAHYDNVVDNAAMDAAHGMAMTVAEGGGYVSTTGIMSNTDYGVEVFFDSLSHGLGIQNTESTEALIRSRVPVLVVVGAEYAVLYVSMFIKDDDGIAKLRTVKLPPRPYSHNLNDENSVVNFTMGETIHVADLDTGELSSSEWYNWNSNTRLFISKENFVNMRLKAISATVTKLLDDGMILAGFGGGFKFFDLPLTEQASFRRAVSSVGLLAYIKGLPLGSDATYDTYAFGGGRIVKREQIVGYDFETAKVYCVFDCDLYAQRLKESSILADEITIFSSGREAAQNGYNPCLLCSKY